MPRIKTTSRKSEPIMSTDPRPTKGGKQPRSMYVPRSEKTAVAAGKRPFPVDSEPWINKANPPPRQVPVPKKDAASLTEAKAYAPYASKEKIARMTCYDETKALSKKIWLTVFEYFAGITDGSITNVFGSGITPGYCLVINLRHPDVDYYRPRATIDKQIVVGPDDLTPPGKFHTNQKIKFEKGFRKFTRRQDYVDGVKQMVLTVIAASQWYRFPKHTQLIIPLTESRDGGIGYGQFIFDFRRERNYFGKFKTHHWRHQLPTPPEKTTLLRQPVITESIKKVDEEFIDLTDEDEDETKTLMPDPIEDRWDDLSDDADGEETDDEVMPPPEVKKPVAEKVALPPKDDEVIQALDLSLPKSKKIKRTCEICESACEGDNVICEQCYQDQAEEKIDETIDDVIGKPVNTCHVCDIELTEERARLCTWCRDTLLINMIKK